MLRLTMAAARRLGIFGLIISGLCVSVDALTLSVTAGDWPGWRGPNRDDVSTETGLLPSWPSEGPKKLWTSSDAGLGYSGLAVVGDVIYTMGADEAGESLLALKAADGTKIWSTPVGSLLENGWGNGPRSTPTYADGHVVGIGGQGDVVCVSAADGSVKWKASFTELGGSVPKWGFSESVLIDGDAVICTPGGAQGTLVCFDLKTGEKRWQSSEVTVDAHYSSVIVVDHFGKKQYIQLTEKKVFGVDADGKLQWQADWTGSVAVIPTPIYKDGQVYVTSGYGAGCMLLNISPNNEVQKLYENKIMKNHHGGVILLGDYLYGHSDADGWICQKLESGEKVWSNEGKNDSKGCLTFADGKLICLEEQTGNCILAEASSEGWKEISRFKMEPQTTKRSNRGKIWTHPVVANGKLYLRDQEIISCYDISQ
ncbi:MAG: PQQ-like beta-propeller repeat protein [Planctomyces sp.]|nr:PQQ-like beta-propeller repeat protein [Planctomyces sp.]